MALLGVVEHLPGAGDQHEAAADQREAQQMKRSEMGICLLFVCGLKKL
jgi:hypothetical protein